MLGSGVQVGALFASLKLDTTDFDKGVSGASSGFGKLGSAATIGMAVVGAAIIGAGVAAFKMGDTYQQAFNKLAVGAGESTDEIEAAFQKVATNVPQDLDTVAETMDTLGDQMGDLTTDELAALTESVLDFSRVTGTDAVAAAEGLAAAYKNWNVAAEDQVLVQDQLLRVSEASGASVEVLMEGVTKFGPVLRDMGLSLEESVALLGTFEQSGVPVDLAMKGMQKAMVNFSKEGLTMQEGLQGTIDKIVALGPGAEATALAVEAFGSKAGPQLRDAILAGELGIEDMMAAVQDGSITVQNEGEKIMTFGDRVNEGMNKVTVAVGSMMAGLMPALGPMVDQAFNLILAGIQLLLDNMPAVIAVVGALGIAVLTTVVPPFVAWAAATLAATWPLIAIAAAIGIVVAILDKLGILRVIIDLFSQIAHVVMSVVGPAFQFIADLFKNIANAVLPLLRSAFDHLKNAVGIVADFVRTVFTAAMNGIKGAIDFVAVPIRNLADTVFGHLKNAADLLQRGIAAAWDLIRRGIDSAVNLIKVPIQGLQNIFQGLLDTASRIFGDIKRVFDQLVNGVQAAGRQLMTFLGDLFRPLSDSINKAIGIAKDIWNGFVRFWNGFELKIPAIKVGDFQITPSMVFGLPDLPHLAKGGYVPMASLAVVGERGPEIVALPGGSSVYPHGRMPGPGATGPAVGTQNIYGLQPDEVERQTIRAMRRMALEWSL